MSRSRVPSIVARIDRTTPAGSTLLSRVTLATSVRRSSTRNHWIGVSSVTPLIKVTTSALFGPYGAVAFGGAAAAMRFLEGLIDRMALLTATFTRTVDGWWSAAVSESNGITASRGAHS